MEANKNGTIYFQSSNGEIQELCPCTEIVVNDIDEEKFSNEDWELDLSKMETKTINIEILDKSLMKVFGLNKISRKRYKKLLMSFHIPRNDAEKLSKIASIYMTLGVCAARIFYENFPRKDFRKMSIEELRDIDDRGF